MQNLNKENFWNKIEHDHPDAFKVFSEWIDKYKKQVDWDYLFFNGEFMAQIEPDGNEDAYQRAIKFHDIPFEFQIGILARFDTECHYGLISGRGEQTWLNMVANEPRRITSLFQDLQSQLDHLKNQKQ